MADFRKALQYCLENEGGFSDDPNDAGGATNLGITHDDWSAWVGRPSTVEEIKDLSIEKVTPLYKSKYWDVIQGDFLRSDIIATAIFDMAVNRGSSRAMKYAQGAYNSCISNTMKFIDIDGAMGPRTLDALNSIEGFDLQRWLGLFKANVSIGYNTIVYRNPTQVVFLKGWLNRAERLMNLPKIMAENEQD